MNYFKVKDGVVIQVICNPREGFTKTEENIVCGMLYDGKVFTTHKQASRVHPLKDTWGKAWKDRIDLYINGVT